MILDFLARWSFGYYHFVALHLSAADDGRKFLVFLAELGPCALSTLRKGVAPLVLFTVLGITTGYVLKWHFERIWTPYYELIADMFNPVLGLEAPLSLGGFAIFFPLLFRALQRENRTLMHVATAGLFVTTLISASAITAVNSWMQFPSGVRINGQFHWAM